MGTLVSDSIPSLISGVSQQPPSLRLPSQVSEQINAFSSEVDGLRKRPPLILSKKMSSTVFDSAYMHTINRSQDERYDVVITNGDLRVFDKDGDEKTVNFPNGKGYLNTGVSEARKVFRACSVADYTFVVNQTVTAQMSGSVSPSRPTEALVVVKQGAYGKAYSVDVRDGDFTIAFGTFLTPDGSVPAHVNEVSTDHIAAKILEYMESAGTADFYNLTFTLMGSVLHISRASPGMFGIDVLDGFAGNGAVGLMKKVQRFTTLPSVAPEGFYLEIAGDESSAFDNYYVKFERHSEDSFTGVWRETVKENIPYRFNPATVPHILVRESDGTFTFKWAPYGERAVGDEHSNPDPSFIDRKITDVFFYRNRLGFLADENVTLSQAGDVFNFWETTVTTVLEDARIDTAVTTTEAAELRSVVPYNKALLLFGDQQQIAFSGGAVLTANSVSADTVAKFESSPQVRPESAGTGVFFIQENGTASRLMELYVTDDGATLDASDLTNQAPSYFASGVYRITASSSVNLVAILSRDRPSEIGFYKYFSVGRDRVQSALFKWTLPNGYKVLNAAFLGTTLRLVYSRPGEGTFLGYFPLALDARDPDSNYLTHLDERVSEAQCSMVYTPAVPGVPAKTRVTLPYLRSSRTQLVSRAYSGAPDDVVGEIPAVIATGPNYIDVEGDWRTRKFFVGNAFDMWVRLSRIFMRKQSQNGNATPIIGGRLQLRYIAVKYAGTGTFTVTVTPLHRPAKSMVSSGRQIGETVVNEIAVETEGTFRFPVMCRNTDVEIDLVDSSHLPAKFQALEWEGLYTNRDRSL